MLPYNNILNAYLVEGGWSTGADTDGYDFVSCFYSFNTTKGNYTAAKRQVQWRTIGYIDLENFTSLNSGM